MSVTPCAGVWIEIVVAGWNILNRRVTPCAGVWIEIYPWSPGTNETVSHSLCGSVD